MSYEQGGAGAAAGVGAVEVEGPAVSGAGAGAEEVLVGAAAAGRGVWVGEAWSVGARVGWVAMATAALCLKEARGELCGLGAGLRGPAAGVGGSESVDQPMK